MPLCDMGSSKKNRSEPVDHSDVIDYKLPLPRRLMLLWRELVRAESKIAAQEAEATTENWSPAVSPPIGDGTTTRFSFSASGRRTSPLPNFLLAELASQLHTLFSDTFAKLQPLLLQNPTHNTQTSDETQTRKKFSTFSLLSHATPGVRHLLALRRDVTRGMVLPAWAQRSDWADEDPHNSFVVNAPFNWFWSGVSLGGSQSGGGATDLLLGTDAEQFEKQRRVAYIQTFDFLAERSSLWDMAAIAAVLLVEEVVATDSTSLRALQFRLAHHVLARGEKVPAGRNDEPNELSAELSPLETQLASDVLSAAFRRDWVELLSVRVQVFLKPGPGGSLFGGETDDFLGGFDHFFHGGRHGWDGAISGDKRRAEILSPKMLGKIRELLMQKLGVGGEGGGFIRRKFV